MTEWTLVNVPKQAHAPKNKKMVIDSKIIQQQLPAFIHQYKPIAVFLYGSMARGQKNPHDIDLLFIWKKRVPDDIFQIKQEVTRIFQMTVDVVNMIYQGHLITDVHNQNFLDNVFQDAIPIYGETDKFIIHMSQLIGKTK